MQTENLSRVDLTAGYRHDPNLRYNINFPTGSVARSFTVLIATEGPNKKDGLVIIDNDNHAVLCDRINSRVHATEKPAALQSLLLEVCRGLGWGAFSNFVRTRDSYRPGIAKDIDAESKSPAIGNMMNQLAAGIVNSEVFDNRDAYIRSLNDDDHVPYSFPALSREQMIDEIVSHPMAELGSEKCISWDIRMDYPWNMTGRSGTEEENEDLTVDFDKVWSRTLRAKPEIIQDAVDLAMAPYVSRPFRFMGEDDQPLIEMQAIEQGLVLTAFDEMPMQFVDRRDLASGIDDLSDAQICSLWAMIRAMDSDLNRENRGLAVASHLHDKRVKMELEAQIGAEPEINF